MEIPLIIAHRGESFDAPENTMTAINLAWERGADAVEIDVQLSKDEEVVVIHDFNTKRLAGVHKKVAEQTLDELKRLDVGSWKSAKWKGEKIPLLKEVLDTVPAEKKLIIEVKSGTDTISVIRREIEKSTLKPEQVELIGFKLETMSLAKKAFPECNVLWLLDLDYYWYTRIFRPSVSKAILKAKENNLDGLNVWAGNMLDESLIEKVHDAGLLLYCWTVDDIEKAKKLIDGKIDAITTNRAQWLKNKLGLS